ncbi:MAG: PUA domain-containing protein, partial [Candidatus Woesearchaeota archaeon]
YKEDLLLPTLRLILQDNFLKKVVVDMGAVPFAAKGADMMRPGIIEVDTEVEQDDIVAIVDEKNRKPIAIGQTLFSKDEMLMMDRGKMVLNIHHVGDDIWKMGSPD